MGLKIRSLGTSAGFLEKAPVEFADGLTCVIGARGTCKSTVVLDRERHMQSTICITFYRKVRVRKVGIGQPVAELK